MLDISNNNIITMDRGDDVIIPLHIFHGTTDVLTNIAYFPNVNDKIFFAIMEPNKPFEEAIVKQIYYYKDVDKLTGEIRVHLRGIETEFLEPGRYYYTVKVLKKNAFKKTADCEGRPDTVIGKTQFILL